MAAPVDVDQSAITVGTVVRLALLAGDDAELAVIRRVALASSADVVLAMRASDGRSLIERAAALRDARPDAVLIAAGSGGDDLAETVRLAYAEGAHPLLLVSAGDRARDRQAAALAGLDPQAMAPASSAYGRDALVARLRALRRPSGDAYLRDESVEAAARALAIATTRSVVLVDVESDVTTIAYSAADGTSFSASAHVGVGANADRVVARAGLDRVRRWIPRPIDGPALLDRVFNRARWPQAVPGVPLALALEMALAREAIAHVMTQLESTGSDLAPLRAATTIVCSGAPARWPRPQQCVMVVLDALAPTGVHAIVRDEGDALVRAGARASRGNADVAGAVRPVAIVAAMSPRRSLNVTVADATGPVDTRVTRGALVLVPTRGTVELRVNGTVEATASELELGVIIDARGRPLVLPARDAERLPTLARWLTALSVLPAEAVS